MELLTFLGGLIKYPVQCLSLVPFFGETLVDDGHCLAMLNPVNRTNKDSVKLGQIKICYNYKEYSKNGGISSF